jgi:hypothetical protein
MGEQDKPAIRRRDVFRAATAMTAAATTAAPRRLAAADIDASRGKRRSQYQANSKEVQTYYRVNSYPAD